jgi:hypothetical protein
MENQRMTVTVEEAATILGVGRNTLTKPRAAAKFPRSIGKRILVPVASLERLLAVGAQPLGANDLSQPEKASR